MSLLLRLVLATVGALVALLVLGSALGLGLVLLQAVAELLGPLL